MPARTAIALGLAVLSLALACKKPPPPAPSEPEAESCAAACSSLVRAGCLVEGSPQGAEARCAAACLERSRELAPARCESERSAYLKCVGGSVFDCRPLSCSASVCLEQGTATASCGAEFGRFKACIAPCLHAETTHVGARTIEAGGQRRDVKTEVVRAGCTPCSKAKPGAGEGAPCQAHSVCAQSCCRCPDGRAWFLARTCADGHCASGEVACSLGRAAAPADPCANP